MKRKKEKKRTGGELHLTRADVFFGNLSREARESFFLSRAVSFFGRFRRKDGNGSGGTDGYESVLLRKARRTVTAEFEKSFFVTGTRSLGRLLLSVKLRTLGLLLLSFGLWSFLAGFLRMLFQEGGVLPFDRAWFSIALSLSSLPMLFCGTRSVGRSVLQSRFLHFLLFDLLGFFEAPFREAGAREGGGFTAFLLGLLLGAATLFVSPLTIAAAAGILLGLILTLLMPESGFLLLIGTLPFTETKYLLAGVIFVFFSFLLKALRGKRSFRYGPVAFLLTVYALLVLFGTILPTSDSALAGEGWERFLSVSAGLLAIQMIRSSRDALRFAGMLSFSAIASSLLGLLLCMPGGAVRVLTAPDLSFEKVQAFLPTMPPETLACYLTMLLAFLPAFASCLSGGGRRVLLAGITLGTAGLCLLFTWSLPGVVFALLSLLLFLFLRRKAAATVLLLTGTAGVAALLATGLFRRIPFLPRLTASLPARIENLTAFLRTVLSGNPLTGAGSGVSAVRSLFLRYGDPSAKGTTPSTGLYLQVLSENGIVGLIFFLLAVLALLLYCGYARKMDVRYTDPFAQRLLCGGISSFWTILAGGLFLNPLASPSTALCFFCLLGAMAGLASSLVRSGEEENSGAYCDTVLVYRRTYRKGRTGKERTK